MPTLTIQLARPHAGQRRLITEARRFNVVNCGRRFGKTKIGLNLLIEPALAGYPVAWFAPSYRTLLEPWREALKILKPIIAHKNTSERRIELITGGVIEFWSLANADSIRGRKYKRVVLDEAAMVRALKTAWEEVISPMLADYGGDAWFFSTPKGKNYFFELWTRGQDAAQPLWMSWQMPTATNPFISPDEIALQQRQLPSLAFQQEWLAQFLADGGLFRKISESAIAEAQIDANGRPKAVKKHQYVFGLDWGRENDFTVISVVDVTTGEQVYLDRFTEVDYELQKGRLKTVFDVFRPTVILAEQNNMGGPLVEALRALGLPVQPFVTTNATKKEIIDGLALAMEQGTFRFLNDPVLLAELFSFEQTRLPSGLWRYAASGDGHDDCVIALALSHYAAGRGVARLVDNPLYTEAAVAPGSVWDTW